MAFKIKDLMIDIATTADREVATFVHYTIYPTYCKTNTMCPGPSYLHCTYASVTATQALLACGISGWPTGPGPVDLGSLKEQHRAQLAEIETHERAAETAARPQTREQAAELEEKLKAALEEVQSLKKNLPSRD